MGKKDIIYIGAMLLLAGKTVSEMTDEYNMDNAISTSTRMFEKIFSED